MSAGRTPEQRATLTRIEMLTVAMEGHRDLGRVLGDQRMELIALAAELEIPVSEIARKASISRQMTYKIIKNGNGDQSK